METELNRAVAARAPENACSNSGSRATRPRGTAGALEGPAGAKRIGALGANTGSLLIDTPAPSA